MTGWLDVWASLEQRVRLKVWKLSTAGGESTRGLEGPGRGKSGPTPGLVPAYQEQIGIQSEAS